ncbi:MAG TPA: hypothetical protein VLL75_01805 [Vicinamibacteria bacterium]|nr:hypothetical protein [Vicinamibacteria bacterium]
MTRRSGVFSLALLLVVPATARPLDLKPRDIHLRAGFSLDPDQFHVGLQAGIGSRGRFGFRPSLDLGLGNGVLLVSLNGDLLYRFDRTKRIQPFLGGGPALSLIDVTDGVGESEGLTAELAGHAVAGLHWLPAPGKAGRRYLVEARAGFGDTPDFKLTLGIAF